MAIDFYISCSLSFPGLPVQKQRIPDEVFGSLKKPHEDDDD
jgi:hypothetical protein